MGREDPPVIRERRCWRSLLWQSGRRREEKEEEQGEEGRRERSRGLARRSRSVGRRRVESLVTTGRRGEVEVREE